MDITEQIAKAVALEPPYPVLDENREQKQDREGRPLYKVKVAFVGGNDERANVEAIKTAEIVGEYEPLTEVQLDGISFATWSFEGKSGVAWTANRIILGEGAA